MRTGELLVAVLLGMAVACGGDATTDAPPFVPAPAPPAPADGLEGDPAVHTVFVDDERYTPATLTIHVGESVRWVWRSPARSVTSGPACDEDGAFDTGPQEIGVVYARPFTMPGLQDFHDRRACAGGMVGRVVIIP